jgi:anti-sigma regulatory factor (Ser/Thr protein kinase)
MPDNQGGATGGVEKAMDSTLDSVDAAESLVLRVAQDSGFEEEELHKIGMAVREAMAEENLLRQSGRGLLLIKAFVDEFDMRKGEPPLGTEVKLVVNKTKSNQ